MVMFDGLFDRPGLSLERLRALVEVHEAGSIAAVAGDSASRASQLSRQLSELEGFFGRSLKERRGRKLVLNADGRRLAEHARWTLTGLLACLEPSEVEPPPLRLAAGDSVLHWVVLPRLHAVPGRHAVLGLPRDQVAARVHDGSVDVGVLRKDEVDETLCSVPLGVLEHALFVPRGLASTGPDDDLLFRVPLALQTADTDFLDGVRALAAQRRAKLTIALECETFPQVFRAVRSGHFAGILPMLASAELARARMVRLPRFRSRLHLAWNKRLDRVRPDLVAQVRALGEVLELGHEPQR